MKVFLLGFGFFCILQVSLAEDGIGVAQRRDVHTRPLHKPETQNNPLVIPVPVYTPVQHQHQQYPPLQQFPVQQYPPPQQFPVHQYPYPSVQQLPVQQYPYPPVQQFPVHQPHYQMHAHQHYPYIYPQNFHAIPC